LRAAPRGFTLFFELLDKQWRDYVGFGIDALTEPEAG